MKKNVLFHSAALAHDNALSGEIIEKIDFWCPTGMIPVSRGFLKDQY